MRQALLDPPNRLRGYLAYAAELLRGELLAEPLATEDFRQSSTPPSLLRGCRSPTSHRPITICLLLLVTKCNPRVDLLALRLHF